MTYSEKLRNPKWTPSRITLNIITDALDRKKAFKVFRNSSGGFISKKEVKNIIMNKCNNKCVLCNSKDNLHIDHIKSVYRCFLDNDFFNCNILENLQVLCKKCNTSKRP